MEEQKLTLSCLNDDILMNIITNLYPNSNNILNVNKRLCKLKGHEFLWKRWYMFLFSLKDDQTLSTFLHEIFPEGISTSWQNKLLLTTQTILEKLNTDPKGILNTFVKCDIIDSPTSSDDIAIFIGKLYSNEVVANDFETHKKLKKALKKNYDIFESALINLVNLWDYSNMSELVSLRTLLYFIPLQNSSVKIQNILSQLTTAYNIQNKPGYSKDFLLSIFYSSIMLSTDLHKIESPGHVCISPEQFAGNFQSCEPKEFTLDPVEYAHKLYNDILKYPIMVDYSSTQFYGNLTEDRYISLLAKTLWCRVEDGYLYLQQSKESEPYFTCPLIKNDVYATKKSLKCSLCYLSSGVYNTLYFIADSNEEAAKWLSAINWQIQRDLWKAKFRQS